VVLKICLILFKSSLNETGGSFTAEEHWALFGNISAPSDIFKDIPSPRRGREAAEKSYGNKEALFAEIEAAVDVIPNNDVFLFEHSEGRASWEAWNNFGLAIYAATGGSDDGLILFHRWSEKSPRYDHNTDEKWKAFQKCPPRQVDGIGAGSLCHWADQADLVGGIR
jgi:hypothetical protein